MPAQAGGRLLALQPDAVLCALVGRGNEDAFGALHTRYRQQVFAFVFHLLGRTGSVDDAEDLTQEIFHKVYVNMKSRNEGGSFKAWLFRIARNHTFDHIRARRPQALSLDVPESAPEPSNVVSLHHEVERRDELAWLLGAMQALPDRQRAALVMRELGGMPYDEIAESLETNREGVKQLIKRGRAGVTAAAEDGGYRGRRLGRDLAAVTPLTAIVWAGGAGKAGAAVAGGAAAAGTGAATAGGAVTTAGAAATAGTGAAAAGGAAAGGAAAGGAAVAGGAGLTVAGAKVAATVLAVAAIGTGGIVAGEKVSESQRSDTAARTTAAKTTPAAVSGPAVPDSSLTVGNSDSQRAAQNKLRANERRARARERAAQRRKSAAKKRRAAAQRRAAKSRARWNNGRGSARGRPAGAGSAGRAGTPAASRPQQSTGPAKKSPPVKSGAGKSAQGGGNGSKPRHAGKPAG